MDRSPGFGSSSALRGRPVRLLTLTTLFPNSRIPRHGIFVANRLRRICDTGRAEAKVVAAVPCFPGAYRAYADVPHSETIAGFDVRHPKYVQLPGIGMRIQPDLLARTLLADLRRHGDDASRFDLVDAHYFYPDGVAAARVADALGLPLVITARGSDINLIGEFGFARRRMLEASRRAAALIAVSKALAGRMAELGMPADRIRVLRNGVDPHVFSPMPRIDARRRLGLDESGPWVLGVGNIVHEKGFDLLVRAVALLGGAKLLIVGEGPGRASLRNLALRIAPGRVEFRDSMPQAELRCVYSACDVIGLPSLREGWPNVLLEAMACGTPVVASPVGGVAEMIDAGAPSALASDRTPESWAQAIRVWIDDPPAQGRVREHALRFQWTEVIDEQCAVYEAAASPRAAKAGPTCA